MIYDILPVNNYKGNGSTNKFDFNFYIESADQLKVYLHKADGSVDLLTNEVDYLINELKNENGSYITFPIEGSEYSVLSSQETISLELYLPISQETQYNNSSLLNLSALEYSFDYLTRLIQILSRKLQLCVKFDECTTFTPDELMTKIITLSNNLSEAVGQVQTSLSSVQAIAQEATSTYNDVLDTLDSMSDIQSALDTKANISGDNFASSIKCFDSKWVAQDSMNILPTTPGTTEYSLASWLPNDDYCYDILMTMRIYSTYASTIYLSSSVLNKPNEELQIATTASACASCINTLCIPIGVDRKFSIRIDGAVSNFCYLYYYGYRRVGSNS